MIPSHAARRRFLTFSPQTMEARQDDAKPYPVSSVTPVVKDFDLIA
jgi:hypothetical protein